METKLQNQIVEHTKENSKFFEVRILINGVVVLDYSWPPKK